MSNPRDGEEAEAPPCDRFGSLHLSAFPAVAQLDEGISTELVEPCGALPRKCLFVYLFTVASHPQTMKFSAEPENHRPHPVIRLEGERE
jgi:hypothetical protein